MRPDKKIKSAGGRLLRAVYPRACPICERLLREPSGDAVFINNGVFEDPFICKECAQDIDYISGRRCILCSRKLEEDGELCPLCRRTKRYFDAGYGLMLHDDYARKTVYDLKDSAINDNADFIGLEIAYRYGRQIEMWAPDAMIPVPVHPERLKERGFNQAQLIADKIVLYMKKLGFKTVPVDTEYLIRTGKTQKQKTIDPALRAANMDGAFSVAGPLSKYRCVLLVDDIFTTGATLNECARVLRGRGTERVFFITASIVP